MLDSKTNSNEITFFSLFDRSDDVRVDGGSRLAPDFRQSDGPEAHHSTSPLNTQRSIQQTSTHRRNAQTW